MIGTQVDAWNALPHLEYFRPTPQGSVADPKVIDGEQFAAFGAVPERHIGKMCARLAYTYHPSEHTSELLRDAIPKRISVIAL